MARVVGWNLGVKPSAVLCSCGYILVGVFQALLREQETRHAIEDAEIKGLELQAQKEMLQQVLCSPICSCNAHRGQTEKSNATSGFWSLEL